MNKRIIDTKCIYQNDIDNIKNNNDRDILQKTINMIQNKDVNKKCLFLEKTKINNITCVFVRDFDTGKYLIIDNRKNCVRFTDNKNNINKIDIMDFLEDTQFFN